MPYVCMLSSQVMSHPWPPRGLQPTRLLSLCDFPGKNSGNVLSFPSPGDLSDPGMEPTSPALASRFFTTWEAQELKFTQQNNATYHRCIFVSSDWGWCLYWE